MTCGHFAAVNLLSNRRNCSSHRLRHEDHTTLNLTILLRYGIRLMAFFFAALWRQARAVDFLRGNPHL
jgi:hypothetical protein